MSVYKINEADKLLSKNTYPGRGIITGETENGEYACAAYFIMGRSKNSRNRVFEKRGGDLYTKPFDPSLTQDPSLIIYAAVREYENRLIVTNGDQTDTVFHALEAGKTFEDALRTRTFEPDAPNFTPRISAILAFESGGFKYKMSILKSTDSEGKGCMRSFFEYEPQRGLGHFLHTYMGDGSPLPTFTGEPERVFIENDIDVFSNKIWNSLDYDNKISLYVRYTNLKSMETKEKLINKNTGEI